MLGFFIMFLIVGGLLGYLIEEEKKGLTVIVLLSIGWALVSGPWGIVAFVELLLGFYVIKKARASQ